MNTELFHLGPFEITMWNIILIAIAFLVASICKKIINRRLRAYLKQANIRVEGRRTLVMRLVGQMIYLIAGYVIFLSLQFQNPDVTLREFVEHKIIDTKNFALSFSHIIVVVLVYYIAKLAVHITQLYITQRMRKRKDYDAGLEFVYVQFSKYVIYILAIIFASKMLFSNISGLLTGSLGILVGVGLGLQDVFRDFIAGIVLLGERNLMVGDIIEIPDQDGKEMLVAKVEKIGVRTSKIETRDGNIIIIPNSQLSQNRVENWSHGNLLSRFTIEVPVAYGANTEQVIRLLKQAALSHPKVNKSSEVLVRLANFTPNHMQFDLLFWADQSWQINNCRSEIRMEIDRLFRAYKINMPYPQMDLHFVSDKRESGRNTGHYDE